MKELEWESIVKSFWLVHLLLVLMILSEIAIKFRHHLSLTIVLFCLLLRKMYLFSKGCIIG